MHKDGIKELKRKYKNKKDLVQLVETLIFLNENNLFKDNKGNDLIYELTNDEKNKKNEDDY